MERKPTTISPFYAATAAVLTLTAVVAGCEAALTSELPLGPATTASPVALRYWARSRW